jgi:hypothetical protein
MSSTTRKSQLSATSSAAVGETQYSLIFSERWTSWQLLQASAAYCHLSSPLELERSNCQTAHDVPTPAREQLVWRPAIDDESR